MLGKSAKAWLLAISITFMSAGDLFGADEPKIVGSPMVQVDRVTGTGKAPISFVNSTNADLTIALGAVVGSASKTSRMRVFFSENQQDPGTETLNHTVKKGPMAETVWARVTDAWEPGDTDIDLVDKDAKLGKLKIRRLPFAVKFDGPSPDKAELALVDGIHTPIILKNDDPVKYMLAWRLVLSGSDVCAGRVEIEPDAIAELHCTPKVALHVRELLKEETRDGYLLLAEDTNNTSPPSPLRAFPVKATASWFGPDSRTGLSYLVIVLILTCGGICSLLLSQFLPHRLQRLNIQDQLDAIKRTTADLSNNVDSKLAVLIRIERIGLSELLRSRTVVSPDFAGVLAQCTQAIAQLTPRVRLLQQMDLVLARREDLTRWSVAPTLVDQVDTQIGKAVVLLCKKDPTDGDFQGAKGAVDAAASLVDTLIQPGDDFGKSLRERIQNLVADINANFVNKPSFSRVNQAAPGAWQQVQGVKPEAVISSDQFTSLDMAVAKILLMRDYAKLVEGTANTDILKQLQDREPELTAHLQHGSWEALCLARLLFREMRDGIYPEMLRQALEQDQAEIQMDPSVAYLRAPLKFRIEFQSPPLNTAAAREAWTCHWEFGDGLNGAGWEVSHYFEAPPTLPVTVTFRDEQGKTIADPITNQPLSVKREVSVHPTRAGWTFGERAQMECLKLAAALLVAVFGLVAGAKDQLTKLDVLPGLMAVFLVGFSADTIKNLLTNK